MTIQEVLRKYQHPETELLLGDVLKQSKEFLYLHPKKKLTAAQITKFQTWQKKRKTDYPLAYLRGYKDFYGLRFKVNSHTLIPRPESEWLVDRAIALCKGQSPSIIDIGTGSGCLAISIAKYLPQAKVTAVDISLKALTVARTNAKKHKVKINLRKQNLLWRDKNQYDLIIANLPYVPISEYKKLKSNLRFEPKSALVDPIADFNLYERLLLSVQSHLADDGVVLLEIDPSMQPKLKRFLASHLPKATIKFVKDNHSLIRFAELRLT